MVMMSSSWPLMVSGNPSPFSASLAGVQQSRAIIFKFLSYLTAWCLAREMEPFQARGGVRYEKVLGVKCGRFLFTLVCVLMLLIRVRLVAVIVCWADEMDTNAPVILAGGGEGSGAEHPGYHGEAWGKQCRGRVEEVSWHDKFQETCFPAALPTCMYIYLKPTTSSFSLSLTFLP